MTLAALSSPPVQLTSTQRVHTGSRVADALLSEVLLVDARKVFLLVSKTLNTTTDEISQIIDALGDRVAAVYDGIQPHVPRSCVLKAAAVARLVDTDLVVTVGGGSVTDAGKLIPLALKYNWLEHDDFEPYRVYVNDAGDTVVPTFDAPDVPLICCPTTLSGGEFYYLAGATDEKVAHKQGYAHVDMAPVSIVLDPQLTRHTPKWLWTSTGVRSVDHALETLGSFQSNGFSDAMADAALRHLCEALPIVHADPDDYAGRLRCQIGVWLSMSPIVAGVPMGASHAIGHILGGTCDVPHGYCSCVMAPAVLDFNWEFNEERQRRISECLGDQNERASVLVDKFIRGLDMPRSLAEVGVGPDQFDVIAKTTMMDFWVRTNPRPIDGPADVRKILELALS
ncbi:MAG: iron-containing alcohol dehydrogenase [Porticoccaceae bacterium]|nr:iron-containing alcohol dehydrogenase [Porticoccaceae bacterium]